MPGLQLDKSSRKLKISERDIQRNAEDLLKLDGWRIFRIEKNFSEKKQKATGEVGAPDSLCVRYLPLPSWIENPSVDFTAMADVMWIEWKSLDGKPSMAQTVWQWKERTDGALVLCAGIDFPATIEGWKDWYAASGLQRRKR